MYSIFIKPTALKEIGRLPITTGKRTMDAIESLRTTPRPFGCTKLHGIGSRWRIRIGDYRILYEIDDDAKLVRVFRVAHRKEAYRE